MLLLVQLFLTFLTLAFALPAQNQQQRRSGGSLYGVTYTGYASSGACHSASEVKAAVDRFSRNGIRSIRTYSQECNVLPHLLNAVQGTGITIVASVWLDGNAHTDEAAIGALLHNLNNADPSLISSVIVGNEVIHNGKLSADTVASYIHQVKAAVGDRYRVGTADTPDGYSNDALIAASDILHINVHPFFGGVNAKDAVSNLKSQVAAFQAKTSKEVVIAEVGWPTEGENLNNAVPGVSQLSTVISGLMASNLKYHAFESHDSSWKSGGAYNVEPHFGLVDKYGKSKIPQYI